MFRFVMWIRKRLVVRIIAAVMIVILALSAGNMLIEIRNAKKASMDAISSYGIRLAESYVKGINASRWEQFLKDPKENEQYWSIRKELDTYRTQIGALYVYLVRIDEKHQPLIMIDGQPEGESSASPINEVTDIPEEAVQALLKGNSASSPLIVNPQYGKYVSTYAPLKGADGATIGVLGIDTEAGVVEQISNSLLMGNIPVYLLMLFLTLLGLGAVLLLISRSLRPLQRIVAGAESIAKGDLLLAQQQLAANPVHSIDEIGAVYQAMNKMSGNINDILKTIVSHVSHTSDQFVATTERFNTEAHHLLYLMYPGGTTKPVIDAIFGL